MLLDEPEWIPGGNDAAQWPSSNLLVACAGCQVEVITQAFEKARIEEYDVDVEARFETEDLGPALEGYIQITSPGGTRQSSWTSPSRRRRPTRRRSSAC